MNYAQARLRSNDGRYDWTVRNDDRIWPAGYCAGWTEWTEERAARIRIPLASCLADQARSVPFRAKYHTDGHATQEEAERCWHEYELDQELHERERSSPPDHEERWRCQARWFNVERREGETSVHVGRVAATIQRISPDGDRECDQWTTKALGIGNYFSGETFLCDAHRNRDVYAALHPFAPGPPGMTVAYS